MSDKMDVLAAQVRAGLTIDPGYSVNLQGSVVEANAALDALVECVTAAESEAEGDRNAAWLANKELERIEAALADARNALERIAQNAESWHGPPPDDSGHVRALAVIATWAREVLARLDGGQE